MPGKPLASEVIRQHGTVLDTYQLEGGVWLDPAPVLINEDFDFALAMGMEDGSGAGLAAAKRREKNVQKAVALAAITLPPELHQRLDALRCCGVHVYFLLWGAGSAVLRTVVDVAGNPEASRVIESAARLLSGDAGWETEGALLAEAQHSVSQLNCEHARAHPAR